MILEKKIFKSCQCNFTILQWSPHGEGDGPSSEQTWIPYYYPRMLCAKFGCNWPCGFWEEVENRNSLQTDGGTDRRTTGDKKSSGELKIKLFSFLFQVNFLVCPVMTQIIQSNSKSSAEIKVFIHKKLWWDMVLIYLCTNFHWFLELLWKKCLVIFNSENFLFERVMAIQLDSCRLGIQR